MIVNDVVLSSFIFFPLDLEATLTLNEPFISTSSSTGLTTSSSSSSTSSVAATSSTSPTLIAANTSDNLGLKSGEKPPRRTSADQKTPRIRTVLTEQQLQTLRSVYQTNPRPDALLKEQLCELTGLSPRVIRVWFQNRRCKDKKKALQQAEVARMQQTSGAKVSIL